MKKIVLLLTLAALVFGASDKEVSDFIIDIIKKNPFNCSVLILFW